MLCLCYMGFIFIGMKDLLTIVIPCKNESDLISDTLYHLNKQNSIKGVKVIISDISDDNQY